MHEQNNHINAWQENYLKLPIGTIDRIHIQIFVYYVYKFLSCLMLVSTQDTTHEW